MGRPRKLLIWCAFIVMGCAPDLNNPADPGSQAFFETTLLRCLVDSNCPPPEKAANDFNGDGLSDLLLGAPNTGPGGGDGYGRIIFGDRESFGSTVFTLSGPAGEAQGVCVAGLDMNGDGIQDLVLGAPFANGMAGAVYLFLGGESFGTTSLSSSSASATFTGEALTAGDFLGFHCARAGDVNGDGYDDLIVSATDLSAATADRAYVFFGNANPASRSAAAADVILMGGTLQPQQVAGAGDVNGDGFDDVLVSDQNAGTGGTVYLFHGGSAFQGMLTEANAAVSVASTGTGDFLAVGLAGAGDLNQDGFDDILMGAIKASSDVGEAYLFLGGPGLTGGTTASANVVFQGEGVSANDYLGSAVLGLADLNGDGFREILIGSGKIDSTSGANRAYLFHYTPNLSGTVNVSQANATFTATVGSGKFAFNTVSPGDLNGDGLPDLAMTDHDFNSQQGRVAVFLGRFFSGDTSITAADALLTGDAANDDLGFSIGAGYAP